MDEVAVPHQPEHTDIWREKHRIERDRMEKVRETMGEYDRTVYYPAKQALQARCAAIGHVPQPTYHFGPTGASWRYCNQCGARVDFESGEPHSAEGNDR